MKAKVIIENGLTEIVLTHENDFEKGVMEKMESSIKKHSIETDVKSTYSYGSHNYKISMIIKEKK